MKKYNYLFKLFLALIIFVLFSSTLSYAADEEGIGFEIRPIYSNKQIDRDKGFYYVQTEPGVKQSLELSVLNTTDEDMDIDFVIENAISTTNGNIDYTDDIEKIDDSLKNPMTDILSIKNETVRIKAGEEEIVTFELTPPAEHYEGAKFGRIRILKTSDRENGKGLNQFFSYALGVITSESGVAYNDGDSIELKKSPQANIYLGNKVVEATLVNTQPKSIENLQVVSYVTKKGDSKKVKEQNISNFAFAPNSNVNYVIPWGLSEFKSGEYTFHFEAKNDYESFNIQEDFTIKGNDATRLNKEAAFNVNTPDWIKVTIVSINVVMVGLFIFIIKRDKTWVRELKEHKRKRNKKRKNGKARSRK